ncbi:MAG: YkgJ family cysteine cluster protein [Nitrosotalea sp.]
MASPEYLKTKGQGKNILTITNQSIQDHPCISCHTNCCKEYTIFVNAHDVYRISVGLGLDPENFLEIYGAKEDAWGIQIEEGLVDLALKQKDDTCTFLIKFEDNFRCGIHDLKPGVCKSYPFQLKDGKLIQMDDKLCPVDWDVAKEFETMMTTHLKKDENEWKFYYDLILEWNATNPHNLQLSKFLRFLIERVALSINENSKKK